MSKNFLLGLGAVVIIGGGLILFHKGPELATSGYDDTAAALNYKPQDGEIVVTGTLDCTPLKSGEAVGEGQCVMGLRGDDGKFYSLNTANLQDARGDNVTKNVRAVGTFAPTPASDSEVGIYKYDGVLTVRALDAK